MTMPEPHQHVIDYYLHLGQTKMQAYREELRQRELRDPYLEWDYEKCGSRPNSAWGD